MRRSALAAAAAADGREKQRENRTLSTINLTGTPVEKKNQREIEFLRQSWTAAIGSSTEGK
jgi:hypothetical protein